ncbi:MAG: multiheme c-type cytochrome [Bradymonadia bacterium]
MRLWRVWMWVMVSVIGLSACGGGAPESTPAAQKGDPQLIIVSSLVGYIEPCGCTIDLTLGGIDRLATVIEQARAEGPTLVVAVGPTLFDREPVPDHMVPQTEEKARLLAESLARIKVDAYVPSSFELKRGPDLYRALRKTWKTPNVTVNLSGDAVEKAVGAQVMQLGDLKVGLFGLANPDGGATPGGDPQAIIPAAQAAVDALKAQGAQVIVGLADLPRRGLRRAARKIKGVDLWALGDHPREQALTSKARSAFIIEAGDRGRNVGRVVLHGGALPGPFSDPEGDRQRAIQTLDLQIRLKADAYKRSRDRALVDQLRALGKERDALMAQVAQGEGRYLEYTLVPVAKDTISDPRIAPLMEVYAQKLAMLNVAHAPEPPPAPEGNAYVGVNACADCHEEAIQVWETTPHARAWQTLVDADKTFDAECVSCHVTGWLKPGGVSLRDLRNLTNVQCEVCHGPAERHADVGGDEASVTLKSTEDMCKTCHNAHHSPKFDFTTYLPRILGPGHEAFKAAE